ncbi:MAG: winged helix-turn-helix domain-containing protein [Nitrososphaeraceae archaeon]
MTAANHEATNAKIMYQSSISYTALREYLSFMLEKGLIERKGNKQRNFSCLQIKEDAYYTYRIG